MAKLYLAKFSIISLYFTKLCVKKSFARAFSVVSKYQEGKMEVFEEKEQEENQERKKEDFEEKEQEEGKEKEQVEYKVQEKYEEKQ